MDANKFNDICDTGSLSNGWNGNKKIKNGNEEGRGSAAAAAAEGAFGPTEEDDETEDEYCVYTYKGDTKGDQHLADLPLSFFKFDSSDSQPGPSHVGDCSNFEHIAHNGVHNGLRFHQNNGQAVNPTQGDIFSPDMDFLEMDFDPGGNGEEDDEEDVEFSGDEEQDLVELPTDPVPLVPVLAGPSLENRYVAPVRNSIDNESKKCCTQLVKSIDNSTTRADEDISLQSSSLACQRQKLKCPKSSPSSHNSSYLTEQPHCSKTVFKKKSTPQSLLPLTLASNSNKVLASAKDNDFTSPTVSADEHQITLRLVKSITLPELGSAKECDSMGNVCPSIRSSEISNSAPLMSESNYFASINTSKSSNDSVELQVRGVMIWTVEVAREKSYGQIGRSACGATAVLTVLSALGFNDVSPEKVNECVGTRLRAEDAELPEYLFSRSDAGATHEDLISGMHTASNGCVFGRFFHPNESMKPEKLSKWLLQWICKGAVPVATRNLQVNPTDPESIPDAWHHQMIFGMSSDGVYMTNPIEHVPIDFILSQLTSPSTLLIRRQDVIERKGQRTDLRKLARHPNAAWNDMNVLGQVANMFLEEMPVFNGSSVVKRVRSSHISIPARYMGGITLFIKRDSPSFEQLVKAPEF